MKTSRRILVGGCVALSFFFVHFAIAALAFSDDFNDGNDNGWERYDPLGGLGAGGVGTWSFPTGTYRLQATAAAAPGTTGPARVGAYRENVYAEFDVRMDVVAWPNNLDQLFGAIARISEPGLGTTDGYAFAYETRIGRAATGRLQILRIVNESSTVLASVDMTLTSGHQYRFVFTGLLAQLKGQLFDLTNATVAVATLNANDATYPNGYAGLFTYDTGTGGNHPVDLTVDNFSAGPPAPTLNINLDVSIQTVFVKWPAWAGGFVLESSYDFALWDAVGFNITQDANFFTHTDEVGERLFYRLVSR